MKLRYKLRHIVYAAFLLKDQFRRFLSGYLKFQLILHCLASSPARTSSFQTTSYPWLFQTIYPRIGNSMDQEKMNQWTDVFQQQKDILLTLDSLISLCEITS